MKPLFKWAGGKNKMLKHYWDVMPTNVIEYCEPFFGGGAMFIYVMNIYKPVRATINDINPDIISIYTSIKNNRSEFMERLEYLSQTYISKEGPTERNTQGRGSKGKHCDRWHYYMDIRADHAFNYSSWSKPKEAATLYFLMKTSFNGIFQINKNTNNRYGTPPGLMNEKSSVYDIDVINWWYKTLQSVNIMCGDWQNAVNGCSSSTFFFFDPPYRKSFADYGNGFSDNQLLNLISFANDKPNIMICNRDDDDWFANHKSSLQYKHIDITYTAGRRKKSTSGIFEAKKAKEILLFHRK
jgi:DNA adenine methylase